MCVCPTNRQFTTNPLLPAPPALPPLHRPPNFPHSPPAALSLSVVTSSVHPHPPHPTPPFSSNHPSPDPDSCLELHHFSSSLTFFPHLCLMSYPLRLSLGGSCQSTGRKPAVARPRLLSNGSSHRAPLSCLTSFSVFSVTLSTRTSNFGCQRRSGARSRPRVLNRTAAFYIRHRGLSQDVSAYLPLFMSSRVLEARSSSEHWEMKINHIGFIYR